MLMHVTQITIALSTCLGLARFFAMLVMLDSWLIMINPQLINLLEGFYQDPF